MQFISMFKIKELGLQLSLFHYNCDSVLKICIIVFVTIPSFLLKICVHN